MKFITQAIRQFFIGEYFTESIEEFEKAKIKLNYNFLFILFITSLWYFIYERIIQNTFLSHSFALGAPLSLLLLFGLKYTKNYKLIGYLVSFLLLGYLIITTLLRNGDISILLIEWSMVLLLYASIIMNRKFFIILSSLVFISISSFLVLQKLNIPLQINSSFEAVHPNITMYIFPFLIIVYFLDQYKKYYQIAENKLKCHVEEQEGFNLTLSHNIEKLNFVKRELEEKERTFRLLSQNSRDLIALHKVDGTYTYLSPSVKELLGYEPSELLGRSPFEIFHPEDLKGIIASHQKAKEGSLDNKTQYRIRRKDGNYIWFETITRPIYNKHKLLSKLQTASRDISEQKEIEILLKSSQHMALMGSWEYHVIQDKVILTDMLYSILSLPQNTTIDLESTLDYFKPHCKSILRTSLSRCIDHGENIDHELELVAENGEEKWVRVKAEAILQQGKVAKVIGVIQDITQKKKAELKAYSVAKFPEENPYPIFRINQDGDIIFSNKKDQLLENYFRNNFKDKYKRNVQQILLNGKIFEEEIKINDEYYNVTFTPIPDLGYVNLYGRNISRRKKALLNFETTNAQLTELMNNLEGGLLLENEKHEIIFTNQNFCDLFKIPELPQQLIGTDCSKAAEQSKHLFKNSEEFVSRILLLNHNRVKVLDETLELKDNKTYERDFIPIFIEDKHIGNLWHYRDVTERKNFEESLKQAKIVAEEASKAKAHFLSTISHEIRTPMNAVLGLTNLLLDDDPKKEQIESLKTLRFSGENLLALLNDVLDYNKIEAGKVEFEKIDFDIKELMTRIKHSLEPKVRSKNIFLSLRIDTDTPNKVIGDPLRIFQIINNLANNAIKFTEQGGVSIDITVKEKTNTSVKLEFSVADTGIGITKEKHQSIFESFTQAATETARIYGGTGLGLAIIKRLLELQGSEIKLESETGKGSKFSFELDFGIAIEPFEDIKVHEEIKDFEGIKVLVVDDNKINQMVAARFLSKWKMDVHVADNGKEALELVKKNNYKLILMDLQMPEMDGYSATEEIRKMGCDNEKLPIIALTATTAKDLNEKVKLAGMDDYISKPFKPDELKKIINSYLS